MNRRTRRRKEDGSTLMLAPLNRLDSTLGGAGQEYRFTVSMTSATIHTTKLGERRNAQPAPASFFGSGSTSSRIGHFNPRSESPDLGHPIFLGQPGVGHPSLDEG